VEHVISAMIAYPLT